MTEPPCAVVSMTWDILTLGAAASFGILVALLLAPPALEASVAALAAAIASAGGHLYHRHRPEGVREIVKSMSTSGDDADVGNRDTDTEP